MQEYTTKFKKMAIMLGILPTNPVVLLKYLRGLHSHLRKKVMLFKNKTSDEACVQAQYVENIGHTKGQLSGSKQKENQDSSKEGKKKWNGRYKKNATTTHQCKDSKKHCSHCNIDGHIEDKCWKLHIELNPKNHKKDIAKKNLLAMDSSKEVESNSKVDEMIVCTSMHKEVYMEHNIT